MKEIVSVLKNNEFFKDINEEEIERVLSNTKYTVTCFDKGEIIAHEGEECRYLGLIVKGTIELQRIYSSGRYIVLNRLKEGDVFREALVLSSKSEYPATIVTTVDCKILFIDRNEILNLCVRETRILENFISLLSTKVLMLNKKIKSISFKTVREKVVNFILDEAKTQKTEVIKLKSSKEAISATLGIPRPSLSRELIKLREERFIEFDRNTIKIISKEDLEEELFD